MSEDSYCSESEQTIRSLLFFFNECAKSWDQTSFFARYSLCAIFCSLALVYLFAGRRLFKPLSVIYGIFSGVIAMIVIDDIVACKVTASLAVRVLVGLTLCTAYATVLYLFLRPAVHTVCGVLLFCGVCIGANWLAGKVGISAFLDNPRVSLSLGLVALISVIIVQVFVAKRLGKYVDALITVVLGSSLFFRGLVVLKSLRLAIFESLFDNVQTGWQINEECKKVFLFWSGIACAGMAVLGFVVQSVAAARESDAEEAVEEEDNKPISYNLILVA